MKPLKKAIIFDAGALISLSMNGLTNELVKLKKIFDGSFLITNQVKSEVIDKPLTIKSFELEAFRTKKLLDDGILELADDYGFDNCKVEEKAREIMRFANSFFQGPKGPVNIMHLGEASCLALSKMLNDKKINNVIVIDERTTRLIIENPENLKKIFEKKLHASVSIDVNKLKILKNFKFIRSAELLYIAYERNLFDLKKDRTLLDSLLYAVKYTGTSISSGEIEEIKSLS